MPDSITAVLVQSGAFGVFCAWLMWRDGIQQKRQYELDDRRTERHEAMQREIGLQRRSIDDLIRAIALEALTRPHLAPRAAQEAQEIIDAVKARNSQ